MIGNAWLQFDSAAKIKDIEGTIPRRIIKADNMIAMQRISATNSNDIISSGSNDIITARVSPFGG